MGADEDDMDEEAEGGGEEALVAWPVGGGVEDDSCVMMPLSLLTVSPRISRMDKLSCDR